MAHRHFLVTLSLMSVQAYKYCESTCSHPCTKFPLTMTNEVVDRTSYSHFIRLVFLDGGFPRLGQWQDRQWYMTGILYYIYLMCLCITNIVIIYTLPVRLFLISGKERLTPSYAVIIVAPILRSSNRVSVPLPSQNIFSLSLNLNNFF